MRTPFKTLTFLITGLALFATGCFERSDLYGPLHDGVKMIYAVNPSAYYAYIATEDGYLKKLTVPSTGATGVGAYPVNGKPVILENIAGQLTFYVYENSSWSTVSHSIGTLVSPVRYESTVYYTNSDAIYSFDGKAVQTLVSSVAMPASIQALACYNGEIYVLGDDYKIYRFNGTDTCVSTGTGSLSGTTLEFFAIVNGVAFAGFKNCIVYGALGGTTTTVSLPTTIVQSCAVYDTAHVYAAGFNMGQFEIMKIDGTSFASVTTIADTAASPTISIAALSATKLAVGISGSTSHDGLYVLDTETGEMTMLIAESIGAVNVYNSR